MALKPGLDPRKLEILRLIAEGCQIKTISHELGLSESVVQHNLGSIMTELRLRTRAAMVHYALHHGLVRNMFEKGKK